MQWQEFGNQFVSKQIKAVDYFTQPKENMSGVTCSHTVNGSPYYNMRLSSVREGKEKVVIKTTCA